MSVKERQAPREECVKNVQRAATWDDQLDVALVKENRLYLDAVHIADRVTQPRISTTRSTPEMW